MLDTTRAWTVSFDFPNVNLQNSLLTGQLRPTSAEHCEDRTLVDVPPMINPLTATRSSFPSGSYATENLVSKQECWHTNDAKISQRREHVQIQEIAQI